MTAPSGVRGRSADGAGTSCAEDDGTMALQVTWSVEVTWSSLVIWSHWIRRYSILSPAESQSECLELQIFFWLLEICNLKQIIFQIMENPYFQDRHDSAIAVSPRGRCWRLSANSASRQRQTGLSRLFVWRQSPPPPSSDGHRLDGTGRMHDVSARPPLRVGVIAAPLLTSTGSTDRPDASGRQASEASQSPAVRGRTRDRFLVCFAPGRALCRLNNVHATSRWREIWSSSQRGTKSIGTNNAPQRGGGKCQRFRVT